LVRGYHTVLPQVLAAPLTRLRRKWSNTEIIAYDIGLRLESLEQDKIDHIWALVKASLSEKGYAKVKGAVKMNHFLGLLADNHTILNENSY
jgi:hypothetical protein